MPPQAAIRPHGEPTPDFVVQTIAFLGVHGDVAGERAEDDIVRLDDDYGRLRAERSLED